MCGNNNSNSYDRFKVVLIGKMSNNHRENISEMININNVIKYKYYISIT